MGNQAVQRLIQREGRVQPDDRAAAGGSSGPDGTVAVQRHSSWEHYLLGTVDPDDLEIIGSGRDVKKLDQDRAFGPKKLFTPHKTMKTQTGTTFGVEDVLHVIQQEINRLEIWQRHPPTSYGSVAEQQLKNHLANDNKWQVKVLGVESTFPGKQGQWTYLTYGEMNTMADIFGTPEEMAAHDPDNLHQLLQGVRQQTWLKLKKLYGEISPNPLDSETLKIRYGFSDTKGATGRYDPIVPVGELRLIFGGKTQGNDPTTSYSAGLGRNACHFAPQSWRAWEQYHEKARQLAMDSAQEAQNGNQQQAAKKANDALIQNGFGDHFLQDSYASGHLINKTLIMQWYAEWLNTGGHWHYMKDSEWSRIQNMTVAKQPNLRGDYSNQTGIEPSDPQSVENIPDTPQLPLTSQYRRYKKLGLQKPVGGFMGNWEGTYEDFHKFLNSSLIQAGSNVLHDYFCKKGLVVSSHSHQFIGKIYGDESMLQRESGPGVRFARSTAMMSRQAIMDLLSGMPQENQAWSTAEIFKRFPAYVQDVGKNSSTGGGVMSLEGWHDDNAPAALRNLCETVVFPMAAHSLMKGLVVGLKGKLVDQVSKDEQPF